MKDTVELINAVVRPAVTLTFAAAVVYGFIVGTIGGDTFMAIVSMVLGFWFRDRQEVKEAEARSKK
jgi:hypothetical protein